MSLTIYTYANCDTCRRATKWLQAHAITFSEKPIREIPPSSAELRAMLAARGGELRKLFNTSGRDYRTQPRREIACDDHGGRPFSPGGKRQFGEAPVFNRIEWRRRSWL